MQCVVVSNFSSFVWIWTLKAGYFPMFASHLFFKWPNNQFFIFNHHRKRDRKKCAVYFFWKINSLNSATSRSNNMHMEENRAFYCLIVWLTKSHKMRSMDMYISIRLCTVFCRSAYGKFLTWNENKFTNYKTILASPNALKYRTKRDGNSS